MEVIFISLLLITTTAAAVTQNGEKICITNRNAPPANSYYWPPDTNVKVYFMRNMFTPEQRETLTAAMNTWSKVAAEAGANVTFSYAGETEKLTQCEACLTVTRREVHKQDRRH